MRRGNRQGHRRTIPENHPELQKSAQSCQLHSAYYCPFRLLRHKNRQGRFRSKINVYLYIKHSPFLCASGKGCGKLFAKSMDYRTNNTLADSHIDKYCHITTKSRNKMYDLHWFSIHHINISLRLMLVTLLVVRHRSVGDKILYSFFVILTGLTATYL